MLIQFDYSITSNTGRKEKNQCMCQRRNLIIFLYGRAFLKKTAFDTLLKTQITDVWCLSSAKTLLVFSRTGEILFRFSFAEDTVYLYHFIGPFVDSQRITHIWQNLKAFKIDELKETKDRSRRTKWKHTGIKFLRESLENVWSLRRVVVFFFKITRQHLNE